MQPCRRLYGQLPVFMCKCVNQKKEKRKLATMGAHTINEREKLFLISCLNIQASTFRLRFSDHGINNVTFR